MSLDQPEGAGGSSKRLQHTSAAGPERPQPAATFNGVRRVLSLAVVLALLPLSAQAFTAQNGMQVQQAGASEILVDFWATAADTDYWCAAGDFAARVLNMPNTTRLYRASPKPRGQGQGIAFTLDPSRAAPGAGLSSFGAHGRDGSISVGQAVGAHCRVILLFERF